MLGPHVIEWIHLGLRWLHVIAGVVWIGASFYFVWLNNRVRPLDPPFEGIEGDLWAVHGGAFYRVVKYENAPFRMPHTLHWFKWEAYTTWVSGVALLILIYYVDANLFLIEPSKADLTPLTASLIGIGILVVGWFVYDRLSKTKLLEHPDWFGAVSILLLTGTALVLSHVFSARGAYVHVGALLGTLMAGNVFFVIIPSQRELVAAMEEDREPDPAVGKYAALRSLHNNYMTLPVLFIMISGHFPLTFGHPWSWAILTGLIIVGAAIRHWFNLRGQGRRNVWILPAAAVALVALAVVTVPDSGTLDLASSPVTYEQGIAIVVRRCTPCHSENPSQPGFSVAPKGVIFDTEEQIAVQAALIRRMAVDTMAMPLANLTEMTDEERAQLRSWLDEFTDD